MGDIEQSFLSPYSAYPLGSLPFLNSPPFHGRDTGTFTFTTALFTIAKKHNSDGHPQMDGTGKWHEYTVHLLSCEEKQKHDTCREMNRIRNHYVKKQISQIQKEKSYVFSYTDVRFQCVSGGIYSTGDES